MNKAWGPTSQAGAGADAGAGVLMESLAGFGVLRCWAGGLNGYHFFCEAYAMHDLKPLGDCFCCLFSPTRCRQCVQSAGRVYLWCTVSTDWTQVDVCVYSVYKLCIVSTDYTYSVYVVYRFTRIHVYMYMSRIRAYLPPL